MVAGDDQCLPDVLLEDEEEIIGVYGTKEKDRDGDLTCLGFIVWKPPTI
jgi:hypothetical protein